MLSVRLATLATVMTATTVIAGQTILQIKPAGYFQMPSHVASTIIGKLSKMGKYLWMQKLGFS